MATGDAADFTARLRSVLPARWFPVTASGETAQSPILDAVLTGLGTAWAALYDVRTYVRDQARIGTAYGTWLDFIASDFFGRAIRRQTNESDARFRARILRELLRPRATRAAVIRALTDLTGRAPGVFEPAFPPDTGGWGSSGMTAGTGLGYGLAGGWGSLMLPYQAFITAYRPAGEGVANVMGFTLAGSLIANKLTFPEDFSNAAWVKVNATVGANATRAPDGTLTADALIEAAGSSQKSAYQDGSAIVAGSTITLTCYFKSNGRPAGRLYVTNTAFSSGFYATFNVSAATISTTVIGSGSVVGATLSAVGDGWYLVVITGVIDGATTVPRYRIFLNNAATYTGDGVSGLYMWGAQLLTGSIGYTYKFPYYGAGWAGGGYNQGAIQYLSQDMIAGAVSDAEIYETTARTMPAATIAWTRITE